MARAALALLVMLFVVVVIGVTVWGTDLVLAVSAPHFKLVPAAPAFPAPADPEVANRQDLEYLAQFADLDRSLTPETRAAFETDRQALLTHAAGLTRQQLELGVSHAVAHAGNANSNVDPGPTSGAFNRLPLRLGWFAQGLFVIAALPEAEDLLGSRVLTIDGKTPDEIAAGLRPYRGGGTDANARATGLWFAESPEAMNVVWPEADARSAAFHVVKPDGTQADSIVAARADGASAKAAEWHRLAAAHLPLSLQDPDSKVFFRIIEGGFGFYLRLRELDDASGGPVARQFDAALAQLKAGTARWAVLDLRWVNRGDYLTLESEMRDLPSHIASDGRLYILTGPATLGPGVALTAWAKSFAGGRAVIEGEPLGDHAQYWSEEGAPLVLPNSRITVRFATGYHDWANGCRELRCYWPDILLGVAAGDLNAAVTVPWRFEDYRDGGDTVLQRLSDITRARELAAHS